MDFIIPKIYPITDVRISGISHAEQVERLIAGGATLIQLRDKHAGPNDFYNAAVEAIRIARTHSVRIIINDRVDIALAANADGVHLGQDDLSLSAGRKLMGKKIVGISTHDLDQARAAECGGADYIGFGPMFGTRTKATVYEARGPEMLKQIRGAVRVPIVAIGGITEENIQQVWQAGADSAAIISDILHNDDPGAKVMRILAQRQSYS